MTTVSFLPFGQHPAAGSCAGPYLADAAHLVLHRATRVEVDGVAFADGCQDAGACTTTLGCSHCDYGPEPTPFRDVTLSLRQNGRTWPLDTADARTARDDVGAVVWTFEVPVGVRRGWATLVPEYGAPARVRVR
jgi:hypothetical protein